MRRPHGNRDRIEGKANSKRKGKQSPVENSVGEIMDAESFFPTLSDLVE